MESSHNVMREADRRFAIQEELREPGPPRPGTQPLVSVLVATYQHAPYIQECLDSILGQETNFPFEVLIGEDQSSDGTRELCIEYARRYPDRVRLFLRDRKLSHLRTDKRTIRLNGRWLRRSARGVYLAPCEGDDYWCDPHKLQRQVDMLQDDPRLALVHGDAHQYFQTSGNWRRDIHRTRGDLDMGHGLFQALLTARYRVVTCTAMYRRDLFEKICLLPSYQQSLLQFPMGDTPLWLELARLGNFGYIEQPLGVYRTLEESASHSRDPRRKLAFQKAMLLMRVHYMDCYPVPVELRRQIIQRRARPLLARAASLGEAEMAEQLWKLLQTARVPPRLRDHLYHHCAGSPLGSQFAAMVHRLSERFATTRGVT